MKNIGRSILAILFCMILVASTGAEEKSKGLISEVSFSPVPKEEVVVLDSLVDQYGPVSFDHSMHTSIADSCAQCHHEHAASPSCKGCHSLASSEFKKTVKSSFMPCKSCHDAFDASHPGMPGLKGAYHRTCFECHRGMANVGLDPKGCTESCHVKRMDEASR